VSGNQADVVTRVGASLQTSRTRSIPSTETVSGTVTATTQPGYPVTISNITFTEPGVDKTNNPALEYQYVPHDRPMTQDEINSYCVMNNAASTTRHNNIVTGGTVPDVTAGASN